MHYNFAYVLLIPMLQFMGTEQHRPTTPLLRRKLLLIGCWVCLLNTALSAEAAIAASTKLKHINIALSSLKSNHSTDRS